MNSRNYTSIEDSIKRVNPETRLGNVNSLEPDFELQLKDGIDQNGETYPKNVKIIDNIDNQNKLNDEIIIKTTTDEDFNEHVEKLSVDDLLASEFLKKKKFVFIFSLNGLSPFHVYKYTIMLEKGYEMTLRRMYKIICQSAKHVLEDTLSYLKSINASNNVLFDVKKKLNTLEIDYIGVKIKGNIIYVGFSGFEYIDPLNTI